MSYDNSESVSKFVLPEKKLFWVHWTVLGYARVKTFRKPYLHRVVIQFSIVRLRREGFRRRLADWFGIYCLKDNPGSNGFYYSFTVYVIQYYVELTSSGGS